MRKEIKDFMLRVLNKMNSKKVKFNIQCLEVAVRKKLNKLEGELTEQDLEKIKFLCLDFYSSSEVVGISLDEPPTPFASYHCGDEWECCCASKNEIIPFVESGFDYDVLSGEIEYDIDEIRKFEDTITYYLENGLSKEEYLIKQKESRERNANSWSAYCELVRKMQDEYRERTGLALDSEMRLKIEKEAEAIFKQNKQKQTQQLESLCEQDLENIEADQIIEDIKQFSGLKVLKLIGLDILDFEFLSKIKNLRVLEICSYYHNIKNIKNNVENLEQLCVWCD